MLIVMSGLPATGKTTISRALASQINAVHLRIDTIEQDEFEAEHRDRESGARVSSRAGCRG